MSARCAIWCDAYGVSNRRGGSEGAAPPDRVATVVERLARHRLRPVHLATAAELTERDLPLLALVDAAAVRRDSPLVLWRRADLVHEPLRGWEEQRLAAAAPPARRGEDVMRRVGLA